MSLRRQLLQRWVPRYAFRFTVRRLLVLTTSFAVVLTWSRKVLAPAWVRTFATLYLLFAISWGIIISYSVWQRIRERREEIRMRLENEYQQAKQNQSSTDE